MSKNYNIQDYSIQDLIQLFDLKTTPHELSNHHIQKAEEKIILSLQKGKLSPESLQFFRKGLCRLKLHTEGPKEIKGSNPKNFNDKFNDQFENAIQSKQIEEKRKRKGQWFHVEEDPVIEKAKNIDQIHNQINQMRKAQNIRTEPVYTGGHCDRFLENDEDFEEGYKTSDPFSKSLKFDDIRRVHRDETVIPVELRDNMPQMSLKDYKSHREANLTPIDKNKAERMWALEKQQQEEAYNTMRKKVFS